MCEKRWGARVREYGNMGICMIGVMLLMMFRAMAVDSYVLLLSHSITTGALESPSLLSSCAIITLSSHITIILIITLILHLYIYTCIYNDTMIQ